VHTGENMRPLTTRILVDLGLVVGAYVLACIMGATFTFVDFSPQSESTNKCVYMNVAPCRLFHASRRTLIRSAG
jgi:hypothetical protein